MASDDQRDFDAQAGPGTLTLAASSRAGIEELARQYVGYAAGGLIRDCLVIRPGERLAYTLAITPERLERARWEAETRRAAVTP